MTHLAIKESIKIIERKTDQTLTYSKLAQLYEAGELQICFRWWADKCLLGLISNVDGFDLISEVKLIAVRGMAGLNRKLYLTPSHNHKISVFRAIEKNSTELIEMQFVRPLGSTWQLLLIRDVSDQYLYSIDSKHENGWQLFNSPEYFLDFESHGGASASYTITVDDLLITKESLNAYIAKAKEEKRIDKYSPKKTRECVESLANYVLLKEGSEVVTKARLAEAIFEVIKNTNHINNLKGDGERKIRDWLTPLKKWGKVGRPKGCQVEQAEVLIKTSLSQKI